MGIEADASGARLLSRGENQLSLATSFRAEMLIHKAARRATCDVLL